MNSKLSNHAGHDGNFASLSGVLDTMNAMDSTKPVFPSIFVGDVSGVTIALSSILMALLNKAKGYEYHQFIDVSYAEAVLYLSTLPYSAYQQGGLGTRTRKGFANGGLANYNYYSSKEGDYFMLGSVEYKFFLNFLLAIGLSPEFISTLPEAEKIKAVQAKMSTMTTAELTKIVRI